ncbi:hypothetical protein ACFQS3_06115 [Glycomyces mayteni]|uniref:Uncharacterized protein n=1 Tax=Glycomyces mayteni TaxID=543887 RepID=A0ABW2D369_9ACTN|nr:hypothetical protein GCM10025732_56480 [Glycomyces mayteni]
MDDFNRAGNAVHGARRIWVPLAVVGVLLALTAVEGLIPKALPAGEELPAGTVIEFGSDRDVSAQVGEGWTLDKDASSADSGLAFTQGDVSVQLGFIAFNAAKPDVTEMWEGMDRVLDIERHSGADVALGEPSEFDTKWIEGGLYGTLQIDTRIGTAFVLPAADGTQAVEAKVLGPLHARAEVWDSAMSIIDSVAFDDEEQRA